MTATLRPPGAVPPPARGVPAPAFDSLARPSAPLTPIPTFGPPGGKLDLPAPAPLPQAVNKELLVEHAPGSPVLEATAEAQPQLPSEALEPPAAARPAPASSDDALRSPAPARDALLKIGRFGVDSRTVVMALSALSGALLVAVIGLWLHSRKEVEPEAAPSAHVAPASAPLQAAPAGCKLLLPAARVAANIERTVPPSTSKIGNEGALALGIAESKTKGVGLRIDPNTLDVLPTFEEEGKEAVHGVVPLTRSGALAFFVDRDDRALHTRRTPSTRSRPSLWA